MHNAFSPSLNLVPFCQPCLVFVTCAHRSVILGMKCCGMSSTGCVVHVVVYGEWVVLWVAANFVAIECGRHG